MTSKVLKTITEHNMLSVGDTVGVGLSGGADSVCLVHFLSKNKDSLGIKKLKAIHIHHGIRGDEADRDSEFVKNFCEQNNIEFICFKADVPAEADKTGESLEECARRIRYNFFEQSGCDKIATAHNLNDNMETFLFNLSRGTSLFGLCGIPYVRDNYIRPLLDCTRAEIEDYVKENNLQYVVDSTNFCDDYTRNKIRHNILPQLFEINPAFDKAFSKCNESLRISKDYISQTAEKLVEKSECDGFYDCSVFENCHSALKYQAVSLILKKQNAKNISREHIAAVMGIMEKSGKVNIAGHITANVQRKKLFFGEYPKTEYFEKGIELIDQTIETPVGEYQFRIILNKDLQNLNKSDMDKIIDCDKISNGVLMRNRREGDSIKLAHRPNKTLKKLFNEKKTSVFDREKMLIISDDMGIIWTEFFGTAERCRADKNTKKAVKIIKVG